MWTALELRRRYPEMRITVLERDYCGSGASGRNAGYLLDLWPRFLLMQHLFGEAEAIRIGQVSSDAIIGIRNFCEEHGIQADFEQRGWLWGATCERQAGLWFPMMDALSRHGIQPFQELTVDELHGKYALAGHVAGVLSPSSATVQPALLARGLMRVALAQGIEIYEQSEMQSLKRGSHPEVITDGGRVRAERVVLSMNAWGVRFQEIRRFIAVVRAEGAVTYPNPDLLSEIGWQNGPAITDSRVTVTNYRATPDGRVEFGKAGPIAAYGCNISPAINESATRIPLIRQELISAVPSLAGLEPEMSWSGPIDRSYDGLPVFGFLDGYENVAFACGFSGNGVGPTFFGGKILASLASGAVDEWSTLALVRKPLATFPMEPFRSIGGKLVYSAVQKKDRAEHENNSVDMITRWFASMAPTPLIPQ